MLGTAILERSEQKKFYVIKLQSVNGGTIFHHVGLIEAILIIERQNQFVSFGGKLAQHLDASSPCMQVFLCIEIAERKYQLLTKSRSMYVDSRCLVTNSFDGGSIPRRSKLHDATWTRRDDNKFQIAFQQ